MLAYIKIILRLIGTNCNNKIIQRFGGFMNRFCSLLALLPFVLLSGCFPMAAPERLPLHISLVEAKDATGRFELDLSGQDLDAIPQELAELSGIARLRIRDNRLGDVGSEIRAIAHVPWVDMGRAGIRSLTEDVGALQGLHSWWLSDNALTALPDAMVQLAALRYLNLDRNQLAALPENIGSLQGLRWLRLNRNRLTSLPDSITELPALERLYLAYNQISVLPDDIGRLRTLDTLVLTGNPIAPEELERVRAVLPDCDVIFRVREF
jgi:hypothetical protein